jgi:ubiquinone/menaquinone biosynthesis C-methylase UbiE
VLQARSIGTKGVAEMEYWEQRARDEGRLHGRHFEEFFTAQFELSPAAYAGRRVLDIGCGPRGSLEWATEAAERVGVDPLAEQYAKLGTHEHAMTYVTAGAEHLPFEDGYFDIVTSFNSLDHVEVVDAAIEEYTRVTRPGGTGLLLVEVGHPPTATEPHFLEPELLQRFSGWRTVMSDMVEIRADHDVYASWRERTPWTKGPGVLGARLERRP